MLTGIAKPDANGNNVDFDNAYWAHFAPPVQKLRGADPLNPATLILAKSLAEQGFLIDVPIMVWQWDPFKIMEDRVQYGYTWIPSAIQANVSEAPGVTQPGSTPYDPSTVPPGAIKVSLNFADYPPYEAPQVAAAAPVTASAPGPVPVPPPPGASRPGQ